MEAVAIETDVPEADAPTDEQPEPVYPAYPNVQWLKDGTPLTRANRRRYLKAVGALKGGTRKWRFKAARNVS